MRFKGALLMSALAGSFSLTALPALASAAPSTFPLAGFYQVVADTAHGHLFISPGSGNGNSVIVTDLAGKQITTITGQNGAAGMVLSADGSTLYVADSGAHAVSAIDTATLSQTASYSLDTGLNPADVAVVGGKIWVSYYDTNSFGGFMGEIDPTATTPFTPQALPGSWYSAPQIAVDPSGGGTLVASDSELSTDSVGTYNVSATPPTVYQQPVGVAACEYESDIAVVPGGAQFLMACGGESGALRFDTQTLAADGIAYPSSSGPNTVTVAPDGRVALGIGYTNPDVLVYQAGTTTPVNSYSLGGTYNTVVARGLAWSADGSRLFALIQNWSTTPDTYTVHALNDPGVTASTLTLGGTSSAVLGKTVTLTGKLALTVGKPPANTKIAITRTLAGSTATKQFSVPLAANDTFTLTDKPAQLGTYTYTAHYTGDTTRQPATGTRTVNIVRFPVSLTLTANASSVNYKSKVTLTAHLGTTFNGRTVSIYAQPFGSKTKTLLKSGRVSSTGILSVSYAPVYSTAFSAVFAGDVKYAPKTVTRNVSVRAKVAEVLSGYFSTTHINGVLYRVYHHTATQRVDVTVTPNKAGECVKAEAQIFAQGAWQPDLLTACGTLSAASKTFGLFKLNQVNGFRLRTRIDYIRSSKDDKNVNSDSGWLYFEVVT